MRIGILGGTFDPPHITHLTLARAALEQLQLDEVLWIPAARNPLKKAKSAPAKVRMEMVQLTIEDDVKMGLSNIEIARGGPSYMFDTLSELAYVKPGEYWLLLGGDSLKTFPDWKNPEKILKLARLAVAVRPPNTRDELLAHLPEHWRSSVDWIEMPLSDISATNIRLRSEEKKHFAHLVPPKVYDYIKKHKLYGL